MIATSIKAGAGVFNVVTCWSITVSFKSRPQYSSLHIFGVYISGQYPDRQGGRFIRHVHAPPYGGIYILDSPSSIMLPLQEKTGRTYLQPAGLRESSRWSESRFIGRDHRYQVIASRTLKGCQLLVPRESIVKLAPFQGANDQLH
jgi:hypothetical protein